ncbi:MAG: DUF4019 domain-containing protein [Sphingomonadales bacterium]|nr:DUF4019 domain-containing protein [Sphingomonadales bacterium]
MREGIDALTAKERETLLLLLAGHDVKSIARDLGLSVHTVNDRLRDARRKLGVSSSREAARILGQAEGHGPKLHAGRKIGVADSAAIDQLDAQPEPQKGRAFRFVWFGGGLLVMTLIIAVAMFVSAPSGGDIAQTSQITASSAASLSAARSWAVLLDNQNWSESWVQSGMYFRSHISQEGWTASIRPVRMPLGAVTSRTFAKVTKATSLPGAPAGEYEILEFNANFANRRGAVETVVMAHEKSGWKVVGYFIR